ncbi:MAG: DUF6351 family protein [Burkholderiaceae bacterium]
MRQGKTSLGRSLAHAGFAMGLAGLLLAGCGGGGGGAAPTPPETGGPSVPVDPGTPPVDPGPGPGTPETPAALRVSTLSTQADKVTGNEALVQVELLETIADATVTVVANGADVTADFAPDASGKLVGKITNVAVGANKVDVKYGDRTATLAITGYAVTGPVTSGPQQMPFICQYASLSGRPAGSPALVPTGDDKCSIETRVDYYYQAANTTTFTFLPPTDTTYPASLHRATVNGVANVPMIFRVETGTINRAVYHTALLHDRFAEGAPAPAAPPGNWNRKVIYPLGGGCQGGWFKQGNSTGGVFNSGWLRAGYAVASSTLNVMGNNCNDQLSSETIMMVKERFINQYGVPLFTIGTGGSGGAYQSNQTGDNYPGLFDGIIISQVFADVTSSTLFKQFDSRLLNTYFNSPAGSGYTTAQKRAISGYIQIGNIGAMSGQASRIDPTHAGNYTADVPVGTGPNARYDAVNNRGGARGSVYDHTRNVYGTTSEGHALRPIDNVGVQYGLKALNEGAITFGQFIDLNQKIGGLDRDFKAQAARTAADPGALERAYQSGRIVWGGGGLASMAIIDNRDYNDGVVGGDIHTKIHSFSVRERLRAANGHVDNHVILTLKPGTVDTTAFMDQWLTAVKTDTSTTTTLAQKVVQHRPATLKDACWSGGVKYEEEQVAYGATSCNTFYPAGTTPRMQAGGPLADDIAKCQLKPIDPADYAGGLTPGQQVLLQATFPDGVCDWSKRGVAQQASRPWQSFGPAPKNLLFDITKQ